MTKSNTRKIADATKNLSKEESKLVERIHQKKTACQGTSSLLVRRLLTSPLFAV